MRIPKIVWDSMSGMRYGKGNGGVIQSQFYSSIYVSSLGVDASRYLYTGVVWQTHRAYVYNIRCFVDTGLGNSYVSVLSRPTTNDILRTRVCTHHI